MWPISALIFGKAPLPLPAKVTSTDESASQTPPSHSTSFSASARANSQSLFLIVFPLLSPCFTLSLPDSLLPSLSLSLPSHRDYVSWNAERKDGRERSGSAASKSSRRIQRWPRFSAHFLHFLSLFFAREELQRAVWEAGVWSPGEHQRTQNINQPWNCARACAMTEDQLRERHDGIFLLLSVTLYGFAIWFSNFMSRWVSVQNKDIYYKKKPLNIPDFPSIFDINFAASSLPQGINHAAQPEKCNQELCGVENSPFCLFAVGFLSTTPTCHSHGVTSRSCVFLEEGVSQKGWAFILVWHSKC